MVPELDLPTDGHGTAKSPKALARIKEIEDAELTQKASVSNTESRPDDEYSAKREIDAKEKQYFDGTAKVTDATIAHMVRREEIEAEMIRTKGRVIEGSDNVKAGVTFRDGTSPNSELSPMDFVDPVPYNYRADGVDQTGEDRMVLDTGMGAQRPVVQEIEDTNDPRHPDFMVCGNGNCRYREACLRYRMKEHKTNKAIFFPDACRVDGIFISIDDSDYTGYGAFEPAQLSSTPNF